MRFQIGDLVTSPKWPVIHYGIVSSVSPLRFIHASKVAGRVVETDIGAFAEGQPITIESRAPWGRGAGIVRKARSRLGKAWTLFGHNCEHFARWAFEGEESSLQLRGGLVLGVFVLLVGGGLAAATSGGTYDDRVGRYRGRNGRFRSG